MQWPYAAHASSVVAVGGTCVSAVCGSSSGSLLLLSALQSRCSFEAKFFALQQLLQLLPQQQQQHHQRQQISDLLLGVMRLRVCSDSVWTYSNSSGGGEAGTAAAEFAAAAADPACSPDAAAVHNKLALLVVRLIAADFSDPAAAAGGGAAGAAGGRAAFMPLKQLLHEEVSALCMHLHKAGETAAVAAAEAIAQRCNACTNNTCAVAAGQSLAATLESLRVLLRVLLVLHQEYLEDLPASPVSLELSISRSQAWWLIVVAISLLVAAAMPERLRGI